MGAQNPSALIEAVPHGHWKTTTWVSALRLEGVLRRWWLTRHQRRAVFEVVREHLAPSLRAGDIVIMDNLAVHKVSGVPEALESVGAQLLYLPPYSPDFNPIEQVFAWFKNEAAQNQKRERKRSFVCDRKSFARNSHLKQIETASPTAATLVKSLHDFWKDALNSAGE